MFQSLTLLNPQRFTLPNNFRSSLSPRRKVFNFFFQYNFGHCYVGIAFAFFMYFGSQFDVGFGVLMFLIQVFMSVHKDILNAHQ